MISFSNHTQEYFIDDFFAKFGTMLNMLCPPGKDFTVSAYSLDSVPSEMQETVDFLGDIIDNPCQCWPNPPIPMPLKDVLIYNSNVRNECKLTDEEMKGLLAHEVGHYIFEYSDPKPMQDKEQFCDNIAVKLGLGKELKSALNKLIPICTPDLLPEVNTRIRKL